VGGIGPQGSVISRQFSVELSGVRGQGSGEEFWVAKIELIREKNQFETNIGWYQGSGFRDQPECGKNFETWDGAVNVQVLWEFQYYYGINAGNFNCINVLFLKFLW
jgi:hypothetical protein